MKNGFVYVFRQINTNYVKIGMTNTESVFDRFANFKMYSPTGAEILAIIETTDAKLLESELHNKYSAFRMSGEFFNLNEEQIFALKTRHNLFDGQKNKYKIFFDELIFNKNISELELIKNLISKFENNLKRKTYNDILVFLNKNNFFKTKIKFYKSELYNNFSLTIKYKISQKSFSIILENILNENNYSYKISRDEVGRYYIITE
jgi:hypothetical protein